MKRTLLFIFFLVAGAELAIQVFNWQQYNLYIKPLIVPALIAFYFASVNVKNYLFLMALFFCWLGDVFLLFDQLNELYFMGGLGSFLFAHVLLIFLYRKLKSSQGVSFNGPQRLRVSFPIVLAATGLISILYPSLGALKIPVIIYALALMIMALQAVYRYGFTSTSSFWLVTLGALFFMASDSILAINKFLQPISNAGVLIIATYMAALYLIVLGVASHSNPK